jgi:hypothetical protein
LVVAFTNEQVHLLAERLAQEGVDVVHLAAVGREHPLRHRRLVTTTDVTVSRRARCVVATIYQAGKAAKRSPTDIGLFDLGFVDEAYQVRTDTTALWALTLAPRWAFIGDPGQIEVFTRLGSSPFIGSDDPVASIIDSARAEGADFGLLPFDWTWRLPAHGAEVLEPFYGATVRPAALPDDRQLLLGPRRARRGLANAADRSVDRASAIGWGFLELPGEAIDPADAGSAEGVAAVVESLLGRGAQARCERDGLRLLGPRDIGVAVSTDAQLGLVDASLAAAGITNIEVRTYNRHQGLEYAVSVLWHPLSGVAEADGFYLDLGRLCVGVTRHRHAVVVVGRSGIRRLLADPPLSPEAPWPGRRDGLLGGWLAHAALLEHLDAVGATIAA